MKNQKSINFILGALLITIFSTFNAALANAQQCSLNLVKDKQYTQLNIPQLNTKNKVTVLEFFWYGCPHCFKIQPAFNSMLEPYIKRSDFEIIRIPAVPSTAWEYEARIFYTILLNNRTDLHFKIFQAIHNDKIDFKNKEKFISFFNKNNANGELFFKTMSSFSVEQKINDAKKLTQTFKVMSTPAIVVNDYLMDNKMPDNLEIPKNTKVMIDYLICRK